MSKAQIPLVIIIEHNKPISFDVLSETIQILGGAAEAASTNFLYSYNYRELNFPDELTSRVESLIKENSKHLLWLDTASEGSTIIRGCFIAVVIPILISVGCDVLGKSKHYQEFTKNSGQYVDKVLDHFIEETNSIGNQRNGPESISIKAEVTQDGARIIVRPGTTQTDINYFG